MSTKVFTSEANDDPHLKDLALSFLNKPEFVIKENVVIEGVSGMEYNVDFVVIDPKSNQEDPKTSKMFVKVLDFKKPAGTDVIGKFEKACKDCKAMGLIISNNFSVQAVSLASRAESVMLMSKNELMNVLQP